jgi:hypothetical protein
MVKSALVLALAVASCGPKPAPAPVSLPDVPFAKLDHAQKIEFMKQKVVPAMKPIFQQHDAKKYAEFGCETCHGPRPEERKFEMPQAGLTKIGVSEEFYARFKPADLQWMGEAVLPAMAGLLRLEPSFTDPAPKVGFGCAGCHTFDPSSKPGA